MYSDNDKTVTKILFLGSKTVIDDWTDSTSQPYKLVENYFRFITAKIPGLIVMHRRIKYS